MEIEKQLKKMQNMKTKWGEKHGLINILPNSVQTDEGEKHIDAKYKEEFKKRKEDEHRLVKAKYINYRGKNERLSRPYCRYAGDPIQMWHFVPDHVYEVPKGLVDEVNNNPGLPRRSEVVDAQGVPTVRDGQSEKIHEFVAAGF